MAPLTLGRPDRPGCLHPDAGAARRRWSPAPRRCLYHFPLRAESREWHGPGLQPGPGRAWHVHPAVHAVARGYLGAHRPGNTVGRRGRERNGRRRVRAPRVSARARPQVSHVGRARLRRRLGVLSGRLPLLDRRHGDVAGDRARPRGLGPSSIGPQGLGDGARRSRRARAPGHARGGRGTACGRGLGDSPCAMAGSRDLRRCPRPVDRLRRVAVRLARSPVALCEEPGRLPGVEARERAADPLLRGRPHAGRAVGPCRQRAQRVSVRRAAGVGSRRGRRRSHRLGHRGHRSRPSRSAPVSDGSHRGALLRRVCAPRPPRQPDGRVVPGSRRPVLLPGSLRRHSSPGSMGWWRAAAGRRRGGRARGRRADLRPRGDRAGPAGASGHASRGPSGRSSTGAPPSSCVRGSGRGTSSPRPRSARSDTIAIAGFSMPPALSRRRPSRTIRWPPRAMR